jgi:hypothetical protein
MIFATVTSVQADVQDLKLLASTYTRLWLRTRSEHWAEMASITREVLDREQALLAKASWVDRVLRPDKVLGEYVQR